jgi:3-oxoacyl-[acyl-carrier protein] reductase
MSMEAMKQRIAIVTGASRRRGIGAAVCRTLAARHVAIFFTHWRQFDREMPWGADEDEPESLRAELLGMGVVCEHMETDLSLPATPQRILDEVEKRLGMPSILVNNAAYSTNGNYEELTADMLDAHYAVNMRGTFLLSTKFARRYPGGPGGRIISLTSGQSTGPMPNELAYIATKGAIEAFTVSLAADLAAKGITVNAVDPGATDTGWMPEELKVEIVKHSPHGRIGQPEDAARLIAFLASDEAEWITGQIIHSRGGGI